MKLYIKLVKATDKHHYLVEYYDKEWVYKSTELVELARLDSLCHIKKLRINGRQCGRLVYHENGTLISILPVKQAS